MRIIVIDDDKYYAEPLLWKLEEENYRVTYHASVEESLDYFSGTSNPRPDCLILDVMLPRGPYDRNETNQGRDTGLRLLKDVKGKYADVPVLIVTVRIGLTLRALQEEYGKRVRKVLMKPMTPIAIVDEVDKILHRAD